MTTLARQQRQTGPAILGIEPGLDRSTVRAAGYGEDAASALVSCAEWVATFPVRRVRKKSRLEAICPFVQPSIDAGRMKIVAEELFDPESLRSFDNLLRRNAIRFRDLTNGGDPMLACLVVVVPGVRGSRLLEATHPGRPIKNELMREGIMVGEFFPSCPFATTFNPKLFALRSPAPMYVLRGFIESDWRFIAKVPEWQKTYRERFGNPGGRMARIGGTWWRWKERVRWRWRAMLSHFERDASAEGDRG